jgi:acetyl esterase
MVASVEYRHAPETKFPAQYDDAVAVYKLALAPAGEFGGPPLKVALLGESAGGDLATNVAIKARDQNVGKSVQVVAVWPGHNVVPSSRTEQVSRLSKPLDVRMSLPWQPLPPQASLMAKLAY